MKKLFFSILAVLLLASVPAHAKTYSLTMSSEVDSGGTVFQIDSSDNKDLYPQANRQYAYGVQLTGITPSAAQLAAGGDWGGVSLYVVVKFKSDESGIPWADIEPNYLHYGTAVNSGVSSEIRWVTASPADLARVYIGSLNGATEFGGASAKLIASEIPMDAPDTVVLIPASPAYYLTNTSSGVSTMTVPPGASKTYVRVAGSDIRYTLDGTTPDANSSMILSQGQTLEIDGRGLAQAFKFRETTGGSGSTVYPTHTNERK